MSAVKHGLVQPSRFVTLLALYLPAKANYYSSGKSAQEGHEAIRPTDLSYTPQKVGKRGPFLSCSGYPECKQILTLSPEGQLIPSAVETEHKCEKCGEPMVIRQGRRGPFLACTGYPKCKNAKDVDAEGKPIEPIDTGVKCEKCGGPMVVRKGPRGPFLGCAAYPKCRSYKNLKELPDALKDKIAKAFPAPAKKETPKVEITETCPDCGGAMKLRSGRGGTYFLGCAKYPKCKGTREAPPDLLEQLQTAGAT